MNFAKPSSVEETKILDSLDHVPEALHDNHHFAKLYAHADGFWGKKQRPNVWGRNKQGAVTRKRHKLSRREWIERCFPIRDKDGHVSTLQLNPPQRRFEVTILRMERAKVPVRLQILKARAMGFSTYVQAVAFELGLRNEHVRALIVADTNDRSKVLLQIANIARSKIKKDDKADWVFKMPSKATSSLVWDAPSHAEVRVTSAETDEPGRGGQRTLIHMSEGAWWPDAQQKQLGLLESLPTRPGTYGFDESTAAGDVGKFRDDFWNAWPKKDVPFTLRPGEWHALFYPWFEHPDYYWTKTYGSGRALPSELEAEILRTLSDEEKWLLNQTIYVRWTADTPWECVDGKWRRVGVGPRKVTVDQLAWRRAKMSDKQYRGKRDLFNQEFPARPEDAFLATGRPVFSPDILQRYIARTIPPMWRGELVENLTEESEDEGGTVTKRVRSRPEASSMGGLFVWADADPERQYILGGDTSGGGAHSDFATGVVIEGETCAVVAVWRAQIDPEPWGRCLSRLGWVYNDALLAIETYPSAHGLSAAHAASAYGYRNLYFRQRTDVIAKTMTPQLGWATNVNTKPLMIDRVKRSLEMECPIPAEELVRQLKEQRWGEDDKMESSGHDDLFVAYSIALHARDAAYREGKIRAVAKPKTYNEVFWEHRLKRLGAKPAQRKRYAGL